MQFKTGAGEGEFMASYDAALAQWPVPYTTRYLPTRFGETYVIEGGPESGEPLVLLHGMGTSSTIWIRNVGPLSQTYRTYLVDIPGDANKTRWTDKFRSREDCVQWLSEVLDGLGLARPHLGGLSYGGWQSLNFAMAAPDRVRSLVLFAPAASFAKIRLSFFIHFLGPLLLPTRATFGRTLKWLSAPGQVVDARLADQMFLGVKHFRFARGGIYPTVFADDELRGLHLPTLLLIGEHEQLSGPHEALDRARRLVPGVQAELIPGAGHMLIMEQADLVNQRVLEFLTGTRPDRNSSVGAAVL